MMIERVRLSNVRCHREFEQEFAPGVVLLLGPNGVGKTTVLQGIAWALFDWLPVKQGDFIRRGVKQATVEVDFSHEGRSWRVVRSTNRGLEMFERKGDEYLSVAQGVKSSKDVICEALGLSLAQDLSALYRDAVGGRQSSIMDGFELASKSRQDYWGKILHLDRYRQAYQKLREPVSMLDRKRGDANATIIACNINLEALGVGAENDVAATLIEIRGRVGNLESSLSAMVAFCEVKREELASVQRREVLAVQANARIASLERQIESVGVSLTFADLTEKTYGESMPVLREELAGISVDPDRERDYADVLQRKAALKATLQAEEKTRIRYRDERSEALARSEKGQVAAEEIEKINRKQKTLDICERKLSDELEGITSIYVLPEKEGPCPICETQLSAERVAELRKVQADRMQARFKIANRIDSIRGWQRIHLNRYLEMRLLLVSEDDFDESDAAARRQDDLVVGLETDLENQIAHVARLDKEIRRQRKLEARAQQLEIAIASLEAGYEPGRAEKLRQQLAEFQAEKAGIVVDSPSSEELRVARQAVVEAGESVDEVRDALEGVRVECDRLVRAQGVREVLAQAQVEEDYYNRRWSFLSRIRSVIREAGPHIVEGTVRQVAVLAQQIWQSFGKSEQLTWSGDYELSLGDRSFTLLSGGEKVAAALAIRLAIAKFAADLRWICLDEPTASLDTQTRMALAEIISQLPLEQVFVVSHDDTFTSCAGQVVDLGISL